MGVCRVDLVGDHFSTGKRVENRLEEDEVVSFEEGDLGAIGGSEVKALGVDRSRRGGGVEGLKDEGLDSLLGKGSR